jgi:hypothetical protein
LLFLIYINDLPPTTNTLSELIMLADDASVIITGEVFDDICRISNIVLSYMSKWLAANRLSPPKITYI